MAKAKRIKIHCYHCGKVSFSEVLNTRANKSLGSVRRTRKCLNCGKTFYTMELPDQLFNKWRDMVEVAASAFSSMASHPKISELIDYAKKETIKRKKKRRGSRKSF